MGRRKGGGITLRGGCLARTSGSVLLPEGIKREGKLKRDLL